MRLVTFSMLGALAGASLMATSAQAQEFSSDSEYDLVIVNVEVFDDQTGQSLGRKDLFVEDGRFIELTDHDLGSVARATNFVTGSQYAVEDDDIRAFVRNIVEDTRSHS